MTPGNNNISISKELSEYTSPLASDELLQLEENLIEEGCRVPLTVWQSPTGQILIDGHKRFNICKAHKISFDVREIAFDSVDDVKMWMVDNQLRRGSLTSDQLRYFRGLKYLLLQKGGRGSESIELNTSGTAIKREAQFSKGISVIFRSNPVLGAMILSGEITVKKSDVQTLAIAKDPHTLVIQDNSDLSSKAKVIRDEVLCEVEKDIRRINNERTDQFQKILQKAESIVLNNEDHVIRVKNMIIFAINRAISKKDVQAVKELRKQIDILNDIIFE